MSEQKQLLLIALGMFAGGLLFSGMFVVSGFGLLWMLPSVTFLVGAFMAFLLSFAS